MFLLPELRYCLSPQYLGAIDLLRADSLPLPLCSGFDYYMRLDDNSLVNVRIRSPQFATAVKVY